MWSDRDTRAKARTNADTEMSQLQLPIILESHIPPLGMPQTRRAWIKGNIYFEQAQNSVIYKLLHRVQ